MKEKSPVERIVMLLGMLLGFAVWLIKLIFSLINTLRKEVMASKGGESGVDVARLGDRAKEVVSGAASQRESVIDGTRQFVTEAADKGQSLIDEAKRRAEELQQRGSDQGEGDEEQADIAAEAEAAVAGFGDRDPALGERQHEDIGGVTDRVDVDASGRFGGTRVSDQTVAAVDPETYGTGINEGVPGGMYEEDLDRQDEPRLDEGIPNLGTPEGVPVDDPGAFDETIVEEVEGEETGDIDGDDDDARASDQPWIIEDVRNIADVPAVSRGLRLAGEEIGDEASVEDSEEIGLYGDVDPSGAGGEVDIESDEAPSWDESEMTIVESPDDPVSADEVGDIDDTPTLGLRDSESMSIAGENDDVSGAPMPEFRGVQLPEDDDDDHLGVTGNFDEADATQVIPAAPGDTDQIDSEHADPRQDFVTGETAERAIGDVAGDEDQDARDRQGHEFGQTDEYGAPTDVVEGAYPTGDEEPDTLETEVGDDLSTGDVGRDQVVDEDAFGRFLTGDAADLSTEFPRDTDTVGVSGNFDEARETQVIPAVPIDCDTGAEDADVTSSGEHSGPSAAWSTSSGLTSTRLNMPADVNVAGNVETGAGDEAAGLAEGSSPDAGESPAAPINPNAAQVADDLSDIVSSSAGDMGTTTDGPALDRDDDITAGTARQGAGTDASPTAGDSGPRKSRRERRQASDWVPKNAVKSESGGTCPTDFPIKGNANSRIYHLPTDASYGATNPEYCFATEEDARAAGYRGRKG